jgi:hypothetical protein
MEIKLSCGITNIHYEPTEIKKEMKRVLNDYNARR